MSVAMISLPTVGQSLNKGVLRMMGTVAAAFLAFLYLSWFIQDRWAMLAILTVHVGFCCYMLTGKKMLYSWFVCGYVCLIICIGGGSSSADAFHIAVVRAGETAMGILVYTLVSVFLWPQNNQEALEKVAAQLVSTHIALYQGCRSLLTGSGKIVNTGSLMTEEAKLLTQFKMFFDAATTDSYEVWEVRRQWQQFLRDSHDLMETLERLRASFPELRKLDMPKFLPNLENLCLELDMRFTQIERMLAGNAPERKPQAIVADLKKETLHSLSHLEKATLAVSKNEIDKLEMLSRSLFDQVAGIRGYAQPSIKPDSEKQSPRRWIIDPERFIRTMPVLLTLWISYILWVYVNPPGNASFVELSTVLSLVVVKMNGGRPATALFFPFVIGGIVSGILYLGVMPHFSCYWQLGTLVFVYYFIANYIFWKPQQGLALIGASVSFVDFTNITNEQTYNFSVWSTVYVLLILSMSVAIACTYITTSPHPEKIFLRLINRFFRNCEFHLSRIGPDFKKKTGIMENLKTAVYNNDLMELSFKVAKWGAKIDHRNFPDNSPEQVQALVTALHELALRIKTVTDASQHPQAAYLINELRDDIRTWRVLIEKEFRLLAANPVAAVESGVDMPARLAKQLTMLETHSKATFALKDKGTLNPEDYENFYRLLGSYRGLSESGVKFIQLAGKIDWAHWQEARF